MRTKMQPQVIINGDRKLEKTATSHTDTSHAFCICLPCRFVLSLFLTILFPFTLSHIINRLARCKAPDSHPIPAKCKDDHHAELHNHLHTVNYSQPLSSVHTKDCNLNLALNRFRSVGAGYQANCRVKIYRRLGRVSSGWGWTQHPLRTSFWQLRKTIS